MFCARTIFPETANDRYWPWLVAWQGYTCTPSTPSTHTHTHTESLATLVFKNSGEILVKEGTRWHLPKPCKAKNRSLLGTKVHFLSNLILHVLCLLQQNKNKQKKQFTILELQTLTPNLTLKTQTTTKNPLWGSNPNQVLSPLYFLRLHQRRLTQVLLHMIYVACYRFTADRYLAHMILMDAKLSLLLQCLLCHPLMSSYFGSNTTFELKFHGFGYLCKVKVGVN